MKISFLKLYILVFLALVALKPAFATNVREFGAKGDGITDDTDAIYKALENAKDGVLEFPKGEYSIRKTIEIPLDIFGTLSIKGNGGSAAIIMHGAGPAVRFTGTHENGSALPSTLSASVWNKERMPVVDAIEIRGAHPEANGIEFRNTFQPVIRGVLIRNVRHGLHFTSRNRNVIVESSHIYHCSGIGIFLDAVNIHQMNIGNSHISYCRQGGIKVVNSEIRNFQITGNDIEYNCDPKGGSVADIWIDVSAGGSVREGTIASNTIQAIQSPGGANVRFTGLPGNPDKIGLWSISGNHISNQETNIDMNHVRGISITGNTFIRGYKRHMVIESGHNLVVSSNVFDHNPDYFTPDVNAPGGVGINQSSQILFTQNILEGVSYGNNEAGGALMVTQSRDIDLTGLQISNPAFRGIVIDQCERISVSGCRITGSAGETMITGIVVKNNNKQLEIRNNTISRGTGQQGITGIRKAGRRSNTIVD